MKLTGTARPHFRMKESRIYSTGFSREPKPRPPTSGEFLIAVIFVSNQNDDEGS